MAVRGRHRACGVTSEAQLRMRSLGPAVAAVVVAGVAVAGVVGRVVGVPGSNFLFYISLEHSHKSGRF